MSQPPGVLAASDFHMTVQGTPMDFNNRRIVLCRPQGGLTDQLTQIEKCHQYAERFNRVLVVDTDYENFHGCTYCFLDFFNSNRDNIVILHASQRLPHHLSVHPTCLQGRLDSYSSDFNESDVSNFDVETGHALTFDFSRDHDEEVLVHHQCGGEAAQAILALSKLQLQPHVASELCKRLQAMGGDYVALHIRNTDIKTDFRTVLDKVAGLSFDRLFLATDDATVLEEFHRQLGEKVFTFSHLPRLNGIPLHRSGDQDSWVIMRDAICDLLMLALSSELLMAEVSGWRFSKYSGYSMLAQRLHTDKSMIGTLLGNDCPSGIQALLPGNPDYIPVVLCCDSQSAPYAAVASYSLCKNSRHTLKLIWLVPDQDIDLIAPVISRLAEMGMRPKVIPVNAGMFSHWNQVGHHTVMPYARLLIPDLVAEDKVIYINSDVLVLGDLQPLFSIYMQDAVIGGVLDLPEATTIPMSEGDQYINTGVMLMNLKCLREESFLAHCTHIHDQYRAQQTGVDQRVINVYADKRKHLLNARWNCQILANNTKQTQWQACLDQTRPQIVHFVGSVKPWMAWCNPSVASLWQDYAAQAKIPGLAIAPVTQIDQALALASVLDLNEDYQKASIVKDEIIQHLLAGAR
jgi:lipopolysaccharide biosynthesis glycosyltransferase